MMFSHFPFSVAYSDGVMGLAVTDINLYYGNFFIELVPFRTWSVGSFARVSQSLKSYGA